MFQENEKKLIGLDLITIFLSARETQNEATGIRFRRYNHTIVKIIRVHRLMAFWSRLNRTIRHDEFHACILNLFIRYDDSIS